MRAFILGGAILIILLAGCAGQRVDAPGVREDEPGTRIGGFFRELVEYLKRSDQVAVGDVAPDFELVPLRFYDFGLDETEESGKDHVDRYRRVRLSAFRGVKPVALIFGSYT